MSALDEIIRQAHNGDEDKQDIKEIAAEIFGSVGTNQKSILNSRQVVALVRLKAFAEKYDSDMARLLHEELAQTRVSLGGTGGRRLIEVFKAAINRESYENNEEKPKTKRFLGL